MKEAVTRAFRLTLSPTLEWAAIEKEPPRSSLFASFALPMAAIPALAWALGLACFPEEPYAGPAAALHRGAVLYLGSLASIGLLALAIHLLAPLFGVRRDWARSVQVAAYSGSPVFLSGFMLVYPDFAFILMIAVFHGFFIQYSGVRILLGVREDQAAEYVALCIVIMGVASTLLGAVASAMGVT
jgi:hypothetical protein